MITFNKEKDIEELLRGITKLTPEDFVALAKVMDIKMSLVNKETGEYTLRDAEEIIQDMITSFRKYHHKERKIILKAVKNSGSRS
jgi:plasmid maintenance system antidote protein VapI